MLEISSLNFVSKLISVLIFLLIKILINEPDILLLDEPTNDLDLNTLKWLENFINSSKLPILFISHDETLLENTANGIIHLEQIRRKTIFYFKNSFFYYFCFMATAEQIKSLLQSHYKNDNERFTSIALQVAAHEARQGHMSIAKEIKDLIIE